MSQSLSMMTRVYSDWTASATADLIVQSAVKDQLDNMNVAADFYDALDEEVDQPLDRAAQRAQDNDRKTVQPRDL